MDAVQTNKNDWDRFWASEVTAGNKLSWSKRRIIKVLEPFLTGGKKVLDAGCGSGFFSNYFCQKEMRVIALDYSSKALERTRTRTNNRAQLVQSDLTEPDLPQTITERFDLIFSDGLLEHFDEEKQKKILNNFRELLKEGGRVVTFVPNRFSPWQIIRPFMMPGINETPFIVKTLVSLHKKCGFKIMGWGGVNTFPFALSPDKILGKFFGMLLFVIGER